MEEYIVFDIETTGLNPLKHRVTCIAGKDNEGNKICETNENEKSLLIDFYNFLKENKDKTWVTKNGELFDIPFLFIRMIKHNIDCELLLNFESIRSFDLQNVTKRWISLDDMAIMYRFEKKISNGKKAIQMWEERDFNGLMQYCGYDVDLTEMIYLKYKELGSSE